MAVTSSLADNVTRTGSNSTASTVTGAQFGSAVSGRVLVAPWVASTAFVDPTSGTIAGTSATLQDNAQGVGLAYAVVGSGTSGNLVFNFASADAAAVTGVVKLAGASSATPSSTITTTSTSGTINVGAGGSVVAYAVAIGAGSWTGATEVYSDSTTIPPFVFSVATFDNSGGAITGRTISYSGAAALYAAAFDAASGGGATTLTADAGSYSLTGTAATIKRGRKTAAASGSYALTGTAATLRRGKKLAAAAGSYSLTGTAATLRKGKKLAAGAGSYSLTGTAAGLKRGRKVAASAGSYSLTGSTAGLKHALKVTATAGSYSLTGTAAGLKHAWIVSAGAGSYSVTGTDAALAIHSNKTVTAGAGSYALTGQDATLRRTYMLAAGAGSYSLVGGDATLTITSQKTLAASAGSYLLTGQSASLIRTLNLVAGAGSYSLSGTDAALTKGTGTPAPALDFAPGGYYPWLDRRSAKAKKDIERAEELIEEAPKVVAKAITQIKQRPEALISEPLIATITEALTRAHAIAGEIAGDLAVLQRKQMADAERKRAIRAAKALLDEIEAMERDEDEAIAILLAS